MYILNQLNEYYDNIETDTIKKFKFYEKWNIPINDKMMYSIDWTTTDADIEKLLITFQPYQFYKRKIQLYSSLDTCPICLNDKVQCIPVYDCCHIVCVKCYPKIKVTKRCDVCRYNDNANLPITKIGGT